MGPPLQKKKPSPRWLCFDKGINFFDTAELYPILPKLIHRGERKLPIGDGLKTGKRQDILATKVVGRSTAAWFRDNGDEPELTRPQIMEAIDKALHV